jgi:hypothetical protein
MIKMKFNDFLKKATKKGKAPDFTYYLDKDITFKIKTKQYVTTAKNLRMIHINDNRVIFTNEHFGYLFNTVCEDIIDIEEIEK